MCRASTEGGPLCKPARPHIESSPTDEQADKGEAMVGPERDAVVRKDHLRQCRHAELRLPRLHLSGWQDGRRWGLGSVGKAGTVWRGKTLCLPKQICENCQWPATVQGIKLRLLFWFAYVVTHSLGMAAMAETVLHDHPFCHATGFQAIIIIIIRHPGVSQAVFWGGIFSRI